MLIRIGDGAEDETEGVLRQRRNDGIKFGPLVVDVAHPEARFRQPKPGRGTVGPKRRKLERRGVSCHSRWQLCGLGRRGNVAAILQIQLLQALNDVVIL
jgi:hypothetical protein